MAVDEVPKYVYVMTATRKQFAFVTPKYYGYLQP